MAGVLCRPSADSEGVEYYCRFHRPADVPAAGTPAAMAAVQALEPGVLAQGQIRTGSSASTGVVTFAGMLCANNVSEETCLLQVPSLDDHKVIEVPYSLMLPFTFSYPDPCLERRETNAPVKRKAQVLYADCLARRVSAIDLPPAQPGEGQAAGPGLQAEVLPEPQAGGPDLQVELLPESQAVGPGVQAEAFPEPLGGQAT